LQNTYKTKGTLQASRRHYYSEMSKSKFILCPSGLGWDSYRIWEALAMGVIPVIERHKYRYDQLVFPPDSGKRNVMIRVVENGRAKERMKKKTKNMMETFNATMKTVEYYDGWRRTLEDLPVVWIDGFESKTVKKGKNFLTPKFLEHEYDAMAAKMESFRYEKLTSIYWLRFIESFLLLKEPSNAHKDVNEPIRFDSAEEQQTWEAAMESLLQTFNDHHFLAVEK